MGITPIVYRFLDIFASVAIKKKYIIPVDYSYSTQLKGKCLSIIYPFVYLCFPVDREGKFCYDGIYSSRDLGFSAFAVSAFLVCCLSDFLPVLPAYAILILRTIR